MSVSLGVVACIAIGWALRGVLDRAMLSIAIRVLQTHVGKKGLAAALAKYAEGSRE